MVPTPLLGPTRLPFLWVMRAHFVIKLTTDICLLPSLRVHLNFPVWHNCHGNNHRDIFTFAISLGFSSLFCPLLCFPCIFIVHTLLCPASPFDWSLHRGSWSCLLFCDSVYPSYSVILCTHIRGPLLSARTVCALFCISPFTLLSTSSFFDIFSFEAVEGTSCPCVSLCISLFHYIWFLFLQIPFYPVVKKDLTFIHLGNDSKIEGLINFEKLRMIAKEVRALTNMCSSPYDLLTMLGLGKRDVCLFHSVVSQLQQIG